MTSKNFDLKRLGNGFIYITLPATAILILGEILRSEVCYKQNVVQKQEQSVEQVVLSGDDFPEENQHIFVNKTLSIDGFNNSGWCSGYATRAAKKLFCLEYNRE